MESWPHRTDGSGEGQNALRSDRRPGQTRREAGTQSQGSSPKTARPPRSDRGTFDSKESIVKAILARFTSVVALLAAMALTIGAGVRWS